MKILNDTIHALKKKLSFSQEPKQTLGTFRCGYDGKGMLPRSLGCKANTAFRFYMRLRRPIASKLSGYELSGEVEADESYFGRSSQRKARPRGGGQGWQSIGLLKRGGKYSHPTPGRKHCCRSSRRKSLRTVLFTPTPSRLTMFSKSLLFTICKSTTSRSSRTG
jgi:hypothetical protein